ncbi:MAG TPA: NADH-quinone oxidoreductase subunit NuoK [Steroidobacteraceae bacterium]
MITLNDVLVLSGILFSIGVAGIFLNRRNIIVLLMCIELMLLAVNFNFIAFSRFLGDLSGQIFVFFILTVAAAEAAIGLAILVVLFRERRSIEAEDLDTLQG